MQQVIRTDAKTAAVNALPPARSLDRLKAIRARSESLNLSFKKLIQDAGLVVSTVYRWETGATQPGTYDYNAAIAALDLALAAEEERLRKVLAS